MRISDLSSYVCSSDLLFFEQLRQVSRFEDGQRRQFFNDLCKISHVHSPSEPGYPGSKFQGLVRNHAASLAAYAPKTRRSEERRVGKECVRTCRSRWSQDH